MVTMMVGVGPRSLTASDSKEEWMGTVTVLIFMVSRWRRARPPPLPVTRGLLMNEKPGGAVSVSWEKSFGCCQVSVRKRKSSLWSVMKSARSRVLLLRDLMLKRQSFRQASGIYVDALGREANTLLLIKVFGKDFFWAGGLKETSL